MNTTTLDRQRLYLIGNLSIFMIGLGFAVRAAIAPNLMTEVFEPIDVVNAASMVGGALGATFTGFALTLLFGSALVDWVGIKRMMLFSALGYIAGSLGLFLAATNPLASWAGDLVWISLLLTGLGWGAVEASSNPMITALFPEEKTHRLNVLHAWWPAGIVVGGLAGIAIAALNLHWTTNLALLMLPSMVLVALAIKTDFPVTERVAAGVSYGEMFSELLRRPMFWVFWVCMYFTAAAELAPGQWVNIALSNIVGMQGIVLLVYVSALMFVMRHFAGAMVNLLSQTGLMLMSCLGAGIGLYLLSVADSPALAFLAATVWGIGVCYMWPTMLAITSDRFPRGGALAMGLMGFAGGMSIQFVLPEMGAIFDSAKQLAESNGALPAQAIRFASVESFQAVSIVPLVLLPVFGLIWYADRKNS
jgi:MFS family permease